LQLTLPNTANTKVAYLSVFNGARWKPIWWSLLKNSTANFSKTTCGVVYLPMFYKNGELTPATNPCIVRIDNSVQLLKPDELHTRTITVEEQKGYLKYRAGKKYTLICWNNQWKKIAEQTPTENDTKLTFTNVPDNALLVLIPEYSEGKERPFTISQEGKREWW